jgi:acetyl/propionyl-CoA carboxylase alpha subunit
MIAKVIAHASDRPSAIRRLINALEQTVALGVRTNQAFLIDLLQHPAFQAGELHTGFLAEHRVSRVDATPPEPVLIALALLEPLTRAQAPRTGASDGGVRFPSPWEQLGRWRVHG